MLENTLVELGLTPTEVKVYLALLKLRSVPASTISRHVSVPRSTTKYACEQLSQKGLATRMSRNNCWYYSPAPPSRLQTMLDLRRQELESQSGKLSSIISELTEKYTRDEVTPKVQFFEGVDSIISMMDDVLKDKNPIYGALHLSDDMHPLIADYFQTKYVKERKRGHAPSWMLFNNNERTRAYQEKDHDMNRISLLVPEEDFPFDICFHIYGNKIAFYSYRSSIMTGVIMEDVHIKQMQFSLFKMAWELAKKMEANTRYKNVEL